MSEPDFIYEIFYEGPKPTLVGELMTEEINIDEAIGLVDGNPEEKRFHNLKARVAYNFKDGYILVEHIDMGLVPNYGSWIGRTYKEVLKFSKFEGDIRLKPEYPYGKPTIRDQFKLAGVIE